MMYDIPVYFTTESEAKEFLNKVLYGKSCISLKRCLELGGRDSKDIPDAFSLLGWYGFEGGWNIVYDRMLADYHIEAPEPVALYFSETVSLMDSHMPAVFSQLFRLPRGIDFNCSRVCERYSRADLRAEKGSSGRNRKGRKRGGRKQ